MNSLILDSNDVERRVNSQCPLCKSNKRSFLGFRGPNTHTIARSFKTTTRLAQELNNIKVFKCLACRLLYCDPFPVYNQKVTSIIYDEEYCNNHRSTSEVKATIEQFTLQLQQLTRHLSPGNKDTVQLLDVGAGLGYMVAAAKQLGWNATGIDFSETVCNYANEVTGVDVLPYSIFDERLSQKKYDLILLIGVLEHVNDPLLFFERVVSLLNSKGCIYIDVPNEASFAMRVANRFKKQHQTIHLSPCADPYHLIGFSPRSIKYLANIFELEIVDSITSAVHLKSGTSSLQKMKVTIMNILDRAGSLFNHGSEIFVVFKKTY